MRVKVLFFGRLQEVAGLRERILEVNDGSRIEDLFAHCAHSNPELARYRASLVACVNQEFAPWNTPIHADDEIAFLPPVSGG